MTIQKLAVLTSGGDAPGMNAAVRAVVRAGVAKGLAMFGVEHGFTGLIEGRYRALGPRDVGGIIQQGGTVLGSTRCTAMVSEAGQLEALAQLRARGIGGLVVIGGNGSQTGAHALFARGLPVVGVASTIDNDLIGTDTSIGCTTAADVALEAIDRLRVTAASHGRAFLVEVMGRHSGHLALMAGIGGGAELILVPEVPFDPEHVAQSLREAVTRGKGHAIVVVAEGAAYDAEALSRYFVDHHARIGVDLRVSRLGHIQRGGAPGIFDRLLATRLGAAAPAQLLAGPHGVLLGIRQGQLSRTPLAEVAGGTQAPDPQWIALAQLMCA